MAISVTCVCGLVCEAPEASAGGLARCPACGHRVTVPEPPMGSDEGPLAREPARPATSGKAIASLALGVCFFLAFLSGVPAILLGRLALRDIRGSEGRLGGRRIAVGGIVLGVIGCLSTVPWLLVPAAREDARRAWCANNLKQFASAMHNYHATHDCLPPAAIVDRNGRPLLSWRVAILPYFTTSDLYAKFHLDEPWDSPHNLTLLEPTPYYYTCPSDRDPKPGMTGYQVVVGPATAFRPDFKPVSFPDITDGLDRTLLVGETRHGVPWTKPEDLTLPLTGLGSDHGYHNNGFNALFADGSVRFLKRSISRTVLDALLTRNGKEAVSADSN